MYKAMYELLTGHAPLTDLVPAEHFYEAGSTQDRPYRPYVVIGWLPALAKAGGRYVNICEVRVHDERGSYARIRQVNGVVRALLNSVVQYQGSDGWLAVCSYSGDSGEQVDQDSNTGLQATTWEVVGRNENG
jgi:hypothetical protein